MTETSNIRAERIERLLHDLEYEVTRGMMEGDIDESLGFSFMVPVSKSIPGGAVRCEFRTRPITRDQFGFIIQETPGLRIVK